MYKVEICNSFKFTEATTQDECFDAFDQHKQDKLDIKDFKQLCYALFRRNDEKYLIKNDDALEMFDVFDKNEDDFIDRNEFKLCWTQWIKIILEPKSALIINSMQHEFIEGPIALTKFPAKHNVADIIGPINNLVENVHFDKVVYAKMWHPEDHISFIENVDLRPVSPFSKIQPEDAKPFDVIVYSGPPKVFQRLWPAYCIQNTLGAQLVPELKIAPHSLLIHTGTHSDIDSYSSFFESDKVTTTDLHEELAKLNITDIYVCGLALDCSVGLTVLDGISIGYRSILVKDCCVGINLADIDIMKEIIVRSNGLIITSNMVPNMVTAKDRRPELGYALAMKLKK